MVEDGRFLPSCVPAVLADPRGSGPYSSYPPPGADHSLRTGTTGTTCRLADDLAGAWVRFASTGDLNGAALPRWPAYGPNTRQTLVLGDMTTVESDSLRRYGLLWEEPSGR